MSVSQVDLTETGIQSHLFELYDDMLAEVEVSSVLKRSAEVVSRALDAERATIYLVLEDTQELESAVTIGNVSRKIRIPIREDSLAGFCALKGREIVIADAYGDLSHIDSNLKFDHTWDERNNFRTRDVMCVPARFRDETLGVVQVINSRNGAFEEKDLVLLESVTRFVAYALYHARMYDELATLKGLEKKKAEFMRIMVHELKSPVAASKTLVTALEYATEQNPQVLGVLAKVKGRMDQLLGLVEDILYLSKVKSGKLLSEVKDCDLTSVTWATCENYRDQAEKKGLDLREELPDSPVTVRIDLQGYKLIASNLISNALKYTMEGSVNVSLREDPPWAVFQVRDTGMGIPEADIPKLFGEFFRASNARASSIQGTGVGLAGVKELTERFGGEMELESKENEGSMFTVRLPLSEHAGQAT